MYSIWDACVYDTYMCYALLLSRELPRNEKPLLLEGKCHMIWLCFALFFCHITDILVFRTSLSTCVFIRIRIHRVDLLFRFSGNVWQNGGGCFISNDLQFGVIKFWRGLQSEKFSLIIAIFIMHILDTSVLNWILGGSVRRFGYCFLAITQLKQRTLRKFAELAVKSTLLIWDKNIISYRTWYHLRVWPHIKTHLQTLTQLQDPEHAVRTVCQVPRRHLESFVYGRI